MAHSRLEILGISLISEWDVMAFLYRHGTSLANAGQIARLLGYSESAVVDALERLEFLGLVESSRPSQLVRIYRVAVGADPGRQECFEDLMRLAEQRTGRLLLARELRQPSRRKQRRERDSLHLA